MKRSTITFLLGLVFTIFAPSAFSQNCSPAGPSWFAQGQSYDYIANGVPVSNNCWGLTSPATFVTGTTTCGWSSNAFEFGYGQGGDVSQTVTVPSSDQRTHFSLSYLVDFIDPNHNAAWNTLQVYVWDATANQVIIFDNYNGGMPELDCSRRDSATFNGSLAGHTLVVSFLGSSGFTDTHIRIRLVSLWGWY
ncbi:MAG TPA: hypothetical protein VH724_11440 [Candidatus Angelobacter sp.]|jgi:hypothetical protein|nr:hypothetical protein [Candidatus Angelobacter sp.]